jgi:hypothetical protein
MNGKPFIMYVKEAAKTFEGAHIILADTLDAYNMVSPSTPLEMCEPVALAMGDRWLRKHLDIVSSIFNGNITLSRWSEVKADPNFMEKYDTVVRLYNTCQPVRNYINSICAMYVQQKVDRNDSGIKHDTDLLMENSVNYMLEEVAGTSVYWSWYRCQAIYPGQYFEDAEFFNRYCDTNLTVPTAIDLLGKNITLTG